MTVKDVDFGNFDWKSRESQQEVRTKQKKRARSVLGPSNSLPQDEISKLCELNKC